MAAEPGASRPDWSYLDAVLCSRSTVDIKQTHITTTMELFMNSHKMGNISFKARALGLAFAAVAATFFVAPAATAAPKDGGLAAVCMINAPNSSMGYGHVGWAVKDVFSQWYLGGTEGSKREDNWDQPN